MKNKIDTKKLEQAMTLLIEAIGDDPTRPGLAETPARAAKMFEEMFEGQQYTNSQIAEMFNKCFDNIVAEGNDVPHSNDWVLVKNINLFSFCEHHFALMYNMQAHIAYKPTTKVIGISKIARIANMVGKRLQLQERIGSDISDVLQKILDTPDIMVIIEGEHSCMTARGIRAQESKTRTCHTSGIFKTDSNLRQEVFGSI